MKKWKEACCGQKEFLDCQSDHRWGGYIFHQLFYNRTLQYHISPHWLPPRAADCNVGANAFWFPSRQAPRALAAYATPPACPRSAQSETKNTYKQSRKQLLQVAHKAYIKGERIKETNIEQEGVKESHFGHDMEELRVNEGRRRLRKCHGCLQTEDSRLYSAGTVKLYSISVR